MTAITFPSNSFPLSVALQKSRNTATALIESLKTHDVQNLVTKSISQTEAMAAAAGTGALSGNAPAAGAPQLRQPDLQALGAGGDSPGGEANYTGNALLTLVMGTLSKAVERFETDKLLAAAKAFLHRLAGREAAASELGASYEQLTQELEAAIGASEQLAGQADAALEALEAAQKEVERLEQALKGLSTDDPAYPVLKDELAAAHATLKQVRASAESAVRASDSAANVVASKLEALKATSEQAQALGAEPLEASKVTSNTKARLTELMMLLQQVLAYAKQVALESSAEAAIETMKANESEMLRLADERAEQLAKAEAASKKMGCIGKIIGWVVTVVAVVAAPFTGGVSMALAGVGLALAIAEEVTGFSVMGAALKPVMEVVQKLVTELGKVFGDVFKAMGIPGAEKLAEVMSYVAAAIVVIAVVVVGFVAAKGAMSKILPAVMKQVGKIGVKGGLKMGAKQAAKATAKSATKSTLQRQSATLTAGATIVGGVNQASQSVGNVIVADMRVGAAEKLARSLLLGMNLEQLQKLMDALYEQLGRLEDQIGEATKTLGETQRGHLATGSFIANNIARSLA